MKTFKTYLKEVFDKPVEWVKHHEYQDPTFYTVSALFKIDERTFNVLFEVLNSYWEKSLSIDFGIVNKHNHIVLDLSGNNTDQFKVFSTIYGIALQLKNEGKIVPGMRLQCGGRVERQTQFYQKLFSMLAKKKLLTFDGKDYYVV